MKPKMLQINRVKLIPIMMLLGVWLSGIHMANAQTTHSNNITGTHDGWYFSFWKDNGNASMTLYPGGRYTTTWNGVNNFTAGKGWRTGARDRKICFEGTYNGGSNGFLAIYGWTKNPLIEYYVIETHGQWTPPGAGVQSKGTFTSDGGTYTIYETTRTNQPSIEGTATFQQYWTVRQQKRSSGTVTFANHVAAWEKAGMRMGSTWDYQIVESEGYQSTGNSDITVKNCEPECPTPAPTGTFSYSYEVGDPATPIQVSGTSLKWYETSSSTSPLSSAPTVSTATAGTKTYYVSQTSNNCEGPRVEVTIRVMQTYKIYKVATPLTIDGEEEVDWTDAKIVPMNATKLLSGTVSNASDLSGYAKILWDNTYLYMLAVVTDDTKENDSPNSYDDDLVELYIDGDNAKAATYDANDCQYSFGWDDGAIVGTIPSTASKTDITYAVVETATGYTVEARLPWTTIKGTGSAGKFIGIDFMINDDDNGSTRDAKLSWTSATDDAYQNASLFGAAKLIDETVITGNENYLLEHISIFPNPATSEVNITGFTGNFEYVLFDFAGRTMMQGNNTEKISIAQFEPGVYTLKVKQGDKFKMIKISKM